MTGKKKFWTTDYTFRNEHKKLRTLWDPQSYKIPAMLFHLTFNFQPDSYRVSTQ